MGTLIEKAQYALGTKGLIKTAIENKGVEVQSDVFRTYPDDIGAIQTGNGSAIVSYEAPPVVIPEYAAVGGVISFGEWIDPNKTEALALLASLEYETTYAYYGYYKQGQNSYLLLSDNMMYMMQTYVTEDVSYIDYPCDGVPVASLNYKIYTHNGTSWDSGVIRYEGNLLHTGGEDEMSIPEAVDSLNWLFSNHNIEYYIRDAEGVLHMMEMDFYKEYDIGVLG